VRVLVIGSGAREHALLLALAADPGVTALAAAPGNAGTAGLAEHPGLADPTSGSAVVDLAGRWRADLVVVGPEAPLVAGVGDALREAGIPCFGPTAAAARIEGSKAFAKDVMAAAGVPTAASEVVDTPARLDAVLEKFRGASGATGDRGAPWVVKDDGLAAGKGVLVTSEADAARAHACSLLEAGHPVLFESFLDGPEVSLFCCVDGTDVVPLLPAQDAKRLGDDDAGPNTGGMGAYAPLPWAPPSLVDDVVERIVRPVAGEMVRRGTPFSGLLYAGLALTASGPQVVEFNARFGDPETQAVLALLRSSLASLLLATATGRLGAEPAPSWADGYAVTVVVAAEGYPGFVRTGEVITGADGPGVLHAGTRRRDDGAVVSAGGRVLSVVGTGVTLEAARADAYARLGAVHLPGAHARTDIARAAVEGRIAVPG
jgi:phosphoribosylamine--glycine ligase